MDGLVTFSVRGGGGGLRAGRDPGGEIGIGLSSCPELEDALVSGVSRE